MRSQRLKGAGAGVGRRVNHREIRVPGEEIRHLMAGGAEMADLEKEIAAITA